MSRQLVVGRADSTSIVGWFGSQVFSHDKRHTLSLPSLEVLVPDNSVLWTTDKSGGLLLSVGNTSHNCDSLLTENTHSAHVRAVGKLAMLHCLRTKKANKIKLFGPEEPKGN